MSLHASYATMRNLNSFFVILWSLCDASCVLFRVKRSNSTSSVFLIFSRDITSSCVFIQRNKQIYIQTVEVSKRGKESRLLKLIEEWEKEGEKLVLSDTGISMMRWIDWLFVYLQLTLKVFVLSFESVQGIYRQKAPKIELYSELFIWWNFFIY